MTRCRVCFRPDGGGFVDVCQDCRAIAFAVAEWFAEAEEPSVLRLLPEINACLNSAGAPLYGMDRRRRVCPSPWSPGEATR